MSPAIKHLAEWAAKDDSGQRVGEVLDMLALATKARTLSESGKREVRVYTAAYAAGSIEMDELNRRMRDLLEREGIDSNG
jgi:hypothetical protein